MESSEHISNEQVKSASEVKKSSHTPGPWKWGDGYADINSKYPDCQLSGANGAVVIPIRGDHYEPVWDTAWPSEGEEDEFDSSEVRPCEADRRLIAAAPSLLAACQLEHEVNQYIESLDLNDDTTHPLWPVVVAMRAARDLATRGGAD